MKKKPSRNERFNNNYKIVQFLNINSYITLWYRCLFKKKSIALNIKGSTKIIENFCKKLYFYLLKKLFDY